MVITVVGLGFVGLTAALGFAVKGHEVYGIEKDDLRREQIAGGHIPFYEPGMQEQLERQLNRRLFIRADQRGCAGKSDCVFYCVGTPVGENGGADLVYLFAALKETLSLLPSGKSYFSEDNHYPEKVPVLVIKSTVPPGTMRDRVRPFVCAAGLVPGRDVELANNPEFLREGRSWEDFMQADRLVIGAETDRGFETVSAVYRDFDAPAERVSPTTAEFIKYLSNSMLAAMISYSNEMANAAAQIGDIEIGRAFHILHQDRRWEQNTMSSYVYPGCGYGGYCLPKDTQAMLCAGERAGADMPLLDAVIRTNRNMPEILSDRLLAGAGSDVRIGILGLAFKPFTDDVRDTPAAKLIACLRRRGITMIMAYDPMAENEFLRHYKDLDVECPGDLNRMIGDCDRLAILTAWPEFRVFADWENVWDFRYIS